MKLIWMENLMCFSNTKYARESGVIYVQRARKIFCKCNKKHAMQIKPS